MQLKLNEDFLLFFHHLRTFLPHLFFMGSRGQSLREIWMENKHGTFTTMITKTGS